ncbi:MAG TPA: hypothetical protein EYP46_01680 [Hadesarchaea archaeon]|nr:hypothetical protein [Hadesarchaea archaeon]
MELLTASTGSYPRIGDLAEQQRHRQAYAGREHGEISEEEFEQVQDDVTREAIREQVKAGLDVVTDGQVRWHDPISHFAKKLEGCEINGLLRFFDTNFYFRQPVIHDKLVRRGSILKREFVFAKEVSSKPMKPVVTGPYTLAKLSINQRGGHFRTLVDEFAEIITQEIHDLVKAGAELIQVDEPAILKNPADFQVFKEAVQKVVGAKGKSKIILYTYFGDAAPLYSKLIELPVDGLGLDFTYSQKLVDTVVITGCDKEIGLGLIDGRNTKIERESEVLRILERVLPALEGQRAYLNPSCGLGEYLPREIAFKKLQNMVSIARKAREVA